MGIERARVVEVYSPASVAGRVGAGYLIGERLVLTASDLIARQGPGEVRPAGTATWYSASEVWSAPSGGVTIVEIDEPLSAPGGMRWGDVSGPRAVPVTAMGFPAAAGRPDRYRDAEQFFGRLRAAIVEPSATGRPLGHGLHGAALFAGAELVGVVSTGGNRVTSLPVSAFTADPSFVDLVGQVELVPVRGPAGGLSIL